MTSPAVQRPPVQNAPPTPPAPPAARPPSAPRALQRRAAQRRALAAGLVASVAIHLLAVLASRYLVTFAVPYGPAPQGSSERRPAAPGLRVYQIEPVAGEAAPIEEPVTQTRPETAPTTVAPEPGAERPAEGAGAGRVAAPAERLRPRDVGDPRLWAPLPLLVERSVTPAEAARENLYSRIEALNDSLAIEADAARRARDWTIKGPGGQRWGISSQGIHLGGITLPAPSLGAGREDARERQREWDEIQGQADRARIRDRFDERAREIRERKDKERQQSKQGQKEQQGGQGQQGETKPPAG
jgi:hypothetical protein